MDDEVLRERQLEKMTHRIKSQSKHTQLCKHCISQAVFKFKCRSSYPPVILDTTVTLSCGSPEKVWCSIIPLFTGRVRRPWPPWLNFKWITEGTFMWNVKDYGTWQAITLGDVTLSRGHSRYHCCWELLLPLAGLLIDISLEFRPSVAGILWLRLDRNSIWASTCMNEHGEWDGGKGKECNGGQESETTALEVTRGRDRFK